MTEVFLKIVNMSICASWLVLAVLLLRLPLKKAPKWVNVLLWGIVALRLLCPVSIESPWSLIPSAQTIPDEVLSGLSFDIQTGITPVDHRVNNYLVDNYSEGIITPASNSSHVMTVVSIIWLAGVLLLAAYTAVSYWRLYRKVDTAVLLRKNLFQSEHVDSPFVLGLFHPRIYLPFELEGHDLEYVVAHEMAHIRRRDHWWKPLGFLLLTVHWFNPVMWAAYVLLCRDIELACDEKVIGKLDSDSRADYTQALVACSVNRRVIAACPLAFGEVGVKERVKSVMNYKKPGLWTGILAIIVCAATAVCFLTDPVKAAAAPELNDDPKIEVGSATLSNPDTAGSGLSPEEDALLLSQMDAQASAVKAKVAELNITVLLESIQSSPAGSFDPADHINEHRAEFGQLVNYGEYTLRYCFSELTDGRLLAVRSRIMASVCHEIALRWGDELLANKTSDAMNDQWFDDLKATMIYLSERYSDEELEEMYPASWILLQMMDE